MSEKYSVMMDGREPWFHRNNYPMTHDEVCETLNSQSAEIAGLRETVEGFRKAAKMIQIDIGSKELRDYDRIPIFVSSLGALMEALSSMPNSSEVSR